MSRSFIRQPLSATLRLMITALAISLWLSPVLLVPKAYAADLNAERRSSLLLATRALHDGWASGKTEVMDTWLSPEYTLTDSRGQVHTRDDVLSVAKRHDVELESTESNLSELRLTLAGEAGVVTGINEEKLHYLARNEQRRRRFTDVWVITPTGWQLLATHESGVDFTRISSPPAVRERTPVNR